MKQPALVFDLQNGAASGLTIVLEPELIYFELPPKETVQVHFFQSDKPCLLRYYTNETGQGEISIWGTEPYDYDLFYHGKCIRLERGSAFLGEAETVDEV